LLRVSWLDLRMNSRDFKVKMLLSRDNWIDSLRRRMLSTDQEIKS